MPGDACGRLRALRARSRAALLPDQRRRQPAQREHCGHCSAHMNAAVAALFTAIDMTSSCTDLTLVVARDVGMRCRADNGTGAASNREPAE